jgi:hypothetical protein
MDPKILQKIKEIEERQRVAMSTLLGLLADQTDDNIELKKGLNLELAALTAQLTFLFNIHAASENVDKVLASLPTAEAIQEALSSSRDSLVNIAKNLCGQLADRLRGVATSTPEMDEETRHAFEAVKNLLRAKQRPSVRQVVATIAQEKGLSLTDEYVASTVDNLELLINAGHEQAALFLFKEVLTKK